MNTPPKRPNKKNTSLWDNAVFLFFIGPLLYLFIVALTGNSIFYEKRNTSIHSKRKVFLLSGGALFYFILLLLLLRDEFKQSR